MYLNFSARTSALTWLSGKLTEEQQEQESREQEGHTARLAQSNATETASQPLQGLQESMPLEEAEEGSENAQPAGDPSKEPLSRPAVSLQAKSSLESQMLRAAGLAIPLEWA